MQTREEMMKTGKYDAVRRRLLTMREELIREGRSEIDQALRKAEEHADVVDDADLADIALRDAMQRATFSRHQARLTAVEEALTRIEEGTYGRCRDCGEEIPLARLEILPFATRCVDCQEDQETREAEAYEAALRPWGEKAS